MRTCKFTRTRNLLRATKKLAERKGIVNLEIPWVCLGNVYHVFGVNARAHHLLAASLRHAS